MLGHVVAFVGPSSMAMRSLRLLRRSWSKHHINVLKVDVGRNRFHFQQELKQCHHIFVKMESRAASNFMIFCRMKSTKFSILNFSTKLCKTEHEIDLNAHYAVLRDGRGSYMVCYETLPVRIRCKLDLFKQAFQQQFLSAKPSMLFRRLIVSLNQNPQDRDKFRE